MWKVYVKKWNVYSSNVNSAYELRQKKENLVLKLVQLVLSVVLVVHIHVIYDFSKDTKCMLIVSKYFQ